MAKTQKPEKQDGITTIKIYSQTKERLDKLKEFERESYDEVLRKILFILNSLKKDPEDARSILVKIDSSIKRKERYTLVSSAPKKGEARAEGKGNGKENHAGNGGNGKGKKEGGERK